MARRKKSDDTKRIARLPTTQVTPTELEEVKRRADIVGVTVSDFIRGRALGSRSTAPDAPNSKAVRDLTVAIIRVGNNINQLTRLAHQTGDLDRERALADTLAQIEVALARVISI